MFTSFCTMMLKSSVTIKNKNGECESPCLRPISVLNYDIGPPFARVETWVLLRKMLREFLIPFYGVKKHPIENSKCHSDSGDASPNAPYLKLKH